MNRASLAGLLQAEGVRDDAYDLVGRPGNECLCLEQVSGRWHVYYAERGRRSGEREFENEDDACQYMAQCLLSDSSTRHPGQR